MSMYLSHSDSLPAWISFTDLGRGEARQGGLTGQATANGLSRVYHNLGLEYS